MKAEQREQEFALACANDDNNSIGSDIGLASCVRQTLVFISWLLLLVTFPISLLFCIRIVPEYKRVVVFRLGRLNGREKGPGLFFVIPCVDQARTVDLRIRTFEIPPQDCTTKDAVAVAVEGVVYYHVFNAVLCVTAIEDADHSTRHISSSILRNLVGNMEAREVLFQRDQLKQNIVIQLDEVTVLWGVKLDRVEIKDIRVARNVRRSLSHVRPVKDDNGPEPEDESERRSLSKDADADASERCADQTDCCDLPPLKITAEQSSRTAALNGASPLNAAITNVALLPKPSTYTTSNQRCAAGSNGRMSTVGCNTNANSSGSGSGSGKRATQRTALGKLPSNNLNNQESCTSASTQLTPPNNQQNHVTLNTLRYLNWLNNQNCSTENQPSTLMWPPLEMCFVPVTINTDNQLQSNSNLGMPNARYDEASHSPPYANSKEMTTQPLVHSVFPSQGDSPNLLQSAARDGRDSRSLSPTPPPPPPPVMMQSTYSEQMMHENDQTDVRHDDSNPLHDCGQFNGNRKPHTRLSHHEQPRPHSSLSISSCSTLSDSAAMISGGECRSTVDRSNTKSVPLTGPGSDRRSANGKSHGSQPQLADCSQEDSHVQPKPVSKFTGRHSKPLSPPPIPPPKPKPHANGNSNGNGNGNGNAHDLLLCKATDLASATLLGRRPVPVPAQNAHNNCLPVPIGNRNQQMSNSQLPLPANIGFVPVSLLTNPRSLPVANNHSYPMPMHPADTNNNGNDAAIANKSKFVSDARTSNCGYSTITSTSVSASGSHQPAMKRLMESASSASNSSKRNCDSKNVSAPAANSRTHGHGQFVSFAKASGNSAAKANNATSNV